MAKKIVLLTLHGMGDTKEKYAEGLKAGLDKRLGALWDQVSVQSVFYAPVFQDNENALWTAMAGTPENDLDSTLLRRLFLYGFADAAAFERSAIARPVLYQGIQARIMAALDAGYAACGGTAGTPVVIVAQSLGCQVISSYIWDAQKGKQMFKDLPAASPGQDAFRRLKTLRHMVTTGCNIPIFVAGLDERENFKRESALVQWDNYYDPDDVLGWPVRQLDLQKGSYDWVRDHAISAGNMLTGWNPASHLGYWDDKDVLKPIADSIRTILA